MISIADAIDARSTASTGSTKRRFEPRRPDRRISELPMARSTPLKVARKKFSWFNENRE